MNLIAEVRETQSPHLQHGDDTLSSQRTHTNSPEIRGENPSQEAGFSEMGMLVAGLHFGVKKLPRNYSNPISTHLP